MFIDVCPLVLVGIDPSRIGAAPGGYGLGFGGGPFCCRDDPILQRHVGPERQHVLRHQVGLGEVGPVRDDLVGLGIADARQRLQFLAARAVDVDQLDRRGGRRLLRCGRRRARSARVRSLRCCPAATDTLAMARAVSAISADPICAASHGLHRSICSCVLSSCCAILRRARSAWARRMSRESQKNNPEALPLPGCLGWRWSAVLPCSAPPLSRCASRYFECDALMSAIRPRTVADQAGLGLRQGLAARLVDRATVDLEVRSRLIGVVASEARRGRRRSDQRRRCCFACCPRSQATTRRRTGVEREAQAVVDTERDVRRVGEARCVRALTDRPVLLVGGRCLATALALKSYVPGRWQVSHLFRMPGIADLPEAFRRRDGVPVVLHRAPVRRVDRVDEAGGVGRPAAAGPVRRVAPRAGRAVVALSTVEGLFGEGAEFLVAGVAASLSSTIARRPV